MLFFFRKLRAPNAAGARTIVAHSPAFYLAKQKYTTRNVEKQRL